MKTNRPNASPLAPPRHADDSSLSNVLAVAELTWLDFIRRKDLYVVAIFMLLFAIMAVTVRMVGIESADTARFLMSAGLGLAHVLAAFLAVSFFARTFPEELDRGTLLPLLAKPVTRSQVLLGKSLACSAMVLGAWLIFFIMALLAVPLVEGQRVGALLQVAALELLALAMLAHLSLWLSLHLPVLLAATCALLWHFGGHFLIELPTLLSPLHGTVWASALLRLLQALPDAGLLNHRECFASSSDILPSSLFVPLLAYAAVWTAVFHGLAAWRLERIRP